MGGRDLKTRNRFCPGYCAPASYGGRAFRDTARDLPIRTPAALMIRLFGRYAQGSLARGLIDATLGSAGVRVAGMAVTFLGGVQLARYLGPEQYGAYGLAISVVAIVVVVATLGVPPLATRELAVSIATKRWDAYNGFLRWSLAIVTVTSVIAAVAIAFRIDVLQIAGEGHMALRPEIAVLIPIFALTNLTAAALRGCGAIVGGQSLDALIRPAILSIGLFVAWLTAFQMNANAALLIHAGAGAATLLASLVWLAAIRPAAAASVPPAVQSGVWLRSAIPMGGTDLLRVIEGNATIILISAIVSVGDLGAFRVAVSSAAFLSMPFTLFSIVAAPIVSRLHAEGDVTRLQKVATSMAAVSTGVTVGLLMLIYIIGEPAIRILFGAEYGAAWSVLIILGLAQTLQAVFGVGPTILNATNDELYLMKAYGVSLLIMSCAVLALTYYYGIMGTAWGILIGYFVRCLIINARVKKHVGLEASVFSIRI